MLFSTAFLITVLSELGFALPQSSNSKNGTGNGNNNNNNDNGPKMFTAADGSMVLDQTAQINGLPIRYRVSAPANMFTPISGVPGGTSTGGIAGAMGLNVLLHGDGGQSFFDFPNQGVNANLLGVAVLAPNNKRKWGGLDRKGVQRVDGVAHSQAIVDLIDNELPRIVSFNRQSVHFTGVSGGSLTLAGFLIPAHLGQFKNAGILLNCGGLAPQVQFAPEALASLQSTRIHFQSTQKELGSLQKSIPETIRVFEQMAVSVGLSSGQINALMTVDNKPNGGHCAFDGKKFTSGVRLMAQNFANVVLPGASGEVNGIGNVKHGIVGKEDLQFLEPERN